jgi:hypothetical protein
MPKMLLNDGTRCQATEQGRGPFPTYAEFITPMRVFSVDAEALEFAEAIFDMDEMLVKLNEAKIGRASSSYSSRGDKNVSIPSDNVYVRMVKSTGKGKIPCFAAIANDHGLFRNFTRIEALH